MDCRSCYADAVTILSNSSGFQCILKSLEWKMKSTVWFYRMSVLFILNLILITTIMIYLYVKSCKKYDTSFSNNSKITITQNSMKDNTVLLDGCTSDSD